MVSKIFYVHLYLGKITILTNIFQMGWNHLLVVHEVWVSKIKDPLINLSSDQNPFYWNTVVGFEVGFKSAQNFRTKKHSELNGGEIFLPFEKSTLTVLAQDLKVY